MKNNAAFSRLCSSLVTRISLLNNAHEFDAIIADIRENGKSLQILFSAADEAEKTTFIARLQETAPRLTDRANFIPQNIVSGQSQADKLSPFTAALKDYQLALACIYQHIRENNYQAAVLSAKKSLTAIAPLYPSLSRNNQRILLEDNIMFLAATLDIHADECLDKALIESTHPDEREKLYTEAIQCKADALNFADFVHSSGFSDALTTSQYAISLAYTLSELGKFYLERKKDYEATIKKFREAINILANATPDEVLKTNIQKIIAARQMQIASTQYIYSGELYNTNRFDEAKTQLNAAIAYFDTATDNTTPLINCKIGLVLAMRKSADKLLASNEHKKAIEELIRATVILEEASKRLKREKQMLADAKNESRLAQTDILMQNAKKQLALCQIHLAEIKSQYGAILLHENKQEEAIVQLEGAIAIYEYFYPDETDTLPASRNNLAAACVAIAEKFKQQATQLCDEK